MRAAATRGEFDDLVDKAESEIKQAEERAEHILQVCAGGRFFWIQRFSGSSGMMGDFILDALAQQFRSQLDAVAETTRKLAAEPGRPGTLVEAGEQWVRQVGNPTDGMINTMTPNQLGSASWGGSAGPVFNPTLPAQQNALGAFHGIAEGIDNALNQAAAAIEDFWKTVATLATQLSHEFRQILFASLRFGLRFLFDRGSSGDHHAYYALIAGLHEIDVYSGKLIKAIQKFWSQLDAATEQLQQLMGNRSAFHNGQWPNSALSGSAART